MTESIKYVTTAGLVVFGPVIPMVRLGAKTRLVTAGWLFLLVAELAQGTEGGLGTYDMTTEQMTTRRSARRLLDEDAPLIAVILEVGAIL